MSGGVVPRVGEVSRIAGYVAVRCLCSMLHVFVLVDPAKNFHRTKKCSSLGEFVKSACLACLPACLHTPLVCVFFFLRALDCGGFFFLFHVMIGSRFKTVTLWSLEYVIRVISKSLPMWGGDESSTNAGQLHPSLLVPLSYSRI